MVFTTIFVLLPFALIAAVLYTYLTVDKFRFFGKIEITPIKYFLYVITYLFMILFLTVFLSMLGMAMLLGLLGLPFLWLLDITGIVLLIMRITKRVKEKPNR